MAARRKNGKTAADTTEKSDGDVRDLLSSDSQVNVLSNEMLQQIISVQNDKFNLVITSLQEQNANILNHVIDGFAKLAETFNKNALQTHNDTMLLINKIDSLAGACKTGIRDNTKQNSKKSDPSFQNELTERKSKFYQVYRSRALTSLYKDLIIDEANPFIPPKYRPHVNRTTPEYEKDIKRTHAIQNVLMECDLMNARCKEWERIITEIDDNVLKIINNLQESQELKDEIQARYLQNSVNDQESAKKDYDTNLDKL